MVLREKSPRLKDKRIAHCVTGSIAAIEAPKIARELRRHGAQVQSYMSRDVTKILHPNVMEFATGEEVITGLTGKMEHLRNFDLVLVAPATATTIGKIALGIADGPITALALASRAKIVIAPAMALRMYESQALRENMEKLGERGCIFVEPRFEEEKAKLASMEDVVDAAISELAEKDLAGLNVLVTAGPTLEYMDPLRVITNKSSGKMGLEAAKEAHFRGAEVKLVYGPGRVDPPGYLDVTRVETSDEMLAQVEKKIEGCDVFVSAAAVSDFKPEKRGEKIDSKASFELKLSPTTKILERVKDAGAIRVGFKALHGASGGELEKAAEKALGDYGVDVAVANNASEVMGADEAEVYIATKKGVKHVPRTSKAEVARRLWDEVKGINIKGRG